MSADSRSQFFCLSLAEQALQIFTMSQEALSTQYSFSSLPTECNDALQEIEAEFVGAGSLSPYSAHSLNFQQLRSRKKKGIPARLKGFWKRTWTQVLFTTYFSRILSTCLMLARSSNAWR